MNTKTNKDKKDESPNLNVHYHFDESDSQNLFRICEISRHDCSINLRSFAKDENMDYLVSKALEIFNHVYSGSKKDVNDKDVS